MHLRFHEPPRQNPRAPAPESTSRQLDAFTLSPSRHFAPSSSELHGYHWTALLILGAVMVVLLSLVQPLLMSFGIGRGPRTVKDVVRVAEEQGLYCLTDEPRGIPDHRLVVSETPLTRERICGLSVPNPQRPCWRGTVSIYAGWQQLMGIYDPDCSAIWGELFVYGDPQLILKLTGRTP
jgi:hypothetical protein